ncbi:uncharacterized protein BO66DRAFT_74009 [Aspergillus aculeatinus CBS 121060]|uniref:Uncharacterized protein n=1 Tax=Aspergillus aculeatinus CBS 121060 TaxID=1448322 RepID=A0ACD1HBY2_9EURO|nr:hypothetical protein BO66DRAFT_74009 [Aspergillus aculeatinus CBS 121060]RAH70885.1 hypothetical protein BO66DRAFT_74009 [Aspergillus aculeatinus CBS 121060]
MVVYVRLESRCLHVRIPRIRCAVLGVCSLVYSLRYRTKLILHGAIHERCSAKWPRRQAQHSTGSIRIFTHNNSSLDTVWTGRRVKVAGFRKKGHKEEDLTMMNAKNAPSQGRLYRSNAMKQRCNSIMNQEVKEAALLSCNADAIYARGRIDVGCSRCVGGGLRSGSNANGDSRKNGSRPQWYHSWKCTSANKEHRCFRTSASRSPRRGGEVEDTSVRRPRQ